MNTLQRSYSPSLGYSVRESMRQVTKHCLKNVKKCSTLVEAVKKSDNHVHKIIIPKRIERGPTDILKALASTLRRDYLAPHYKYHDDPFLIPTSNMAKRMYAMSQESGRKAAQWIRKEHADLFQHKVADPQIEVYFPRAVYDENSEVDEFVLQQVIAQHMVSDSLTVYGLLEQKGIEISKSTRQSLLELLCYYNGQDTLEEEWIEERWFRQGIKAKEKKLNTWKRGDAVERIFKSLSPPDTAAYSAMLCGMAQFGDFVGAHNLYQEAANADISLPPEVYNKLIAGASILKESHELRWQFVEEMLDEMKKKEVFPTLGTLNAILETISFMATNKNSKKNALGVIAEFRGLGIEPSLASYYFLLRIFCQERSSVRSGILINIINILQGKPLGIRDVQDTMFFTEAMTVCRFHLSDVDVAYKLDELLHTGDNYNLIGDSFKESVYYRNFFTLVCQMGTLKEFMELYERLVPNVYVPEPSIMEEIIKTITLNEAYDLLPQLWSDMVMFEHADRENLLCLMLSALQKCNITDQALHNKHADVAWGIWHRLENQRVDRRNQKIEWTGEMLGNIVQILLRADRYTQTLEVMNCLDKRQHEVLGVPSIESLVAFLDKSIERNEVKNAIWCIQYCSDAGFEDTAKLVQKLNSTVQLSEREQTAIVNIVGFDVMKKHAVTNS